MKLKNYLLSNRNRRGMTLIELVVALATLGLLTVLGSNFLFLGSSTWRRLEVRADSLNTVNAAQSLLRQILTQIYPQTIKHDGEVRIAFDGQPDTIFLQGFLPDSLKSRTITNISLTIEPSAQNTSRNLVMKWHDNQNTRGNQKLLGNIEQAKFSYYESASERWQDHWMDKNKLPDAIRLELQLAANTTTAWPPLIVKPLLSASTTCRYDPGLQGCRE